MANYGPRSINRQIRDMAPRDDVERPGDERPDDNELTLEEAFERINQPFSGFPKIPEIPGYVVTWVRVPTRLNDDARTLQEMTSASSLYQYIPIRPSEIKGFEHFIGRNVAGLEGEVIQYKDCIACKVSRKRYEVIEQAMHMKAIQARESLRRLPTEGRPAETSTIKVSQEYSTKLVDPRTVPLG
jgi:hypothetical protein